MVKNMGYFDKAKADRELSHHGIIGQKWGVRRFQNRDGSLTQAGKAHKKNHDFKDSSESKSLRKDVVKSMLLMYGATAATAAVTAAATASGLIVPQAYMATAFSAIGSVGETASLIAGDVSAAKANKKEKQFEEERSKNPIDKKTGFHKKTTQMSADEDMERVNPGFKNWDANTKNNCVLCTMSMELRRRGYDVQAKKATEGYEANKLVKDWYTGAKPKEMKGSLSDTEAINNAIHGYPMDSKQKKMMVDNTISEIEKQPKGSRGMIVTTWDRSTAGHAVSYANEGGKVVIYDTQANEKYEGERASDYLMKSSQISVTRLDNCKINNKYIKEVAS